MLTIGYAISVMAILASGERCMFVCDCSRGRAVCEGIPVIDLTENFLPPTYLHSLDIECNYSYIHLT